MNAKIDISQVTLQTDRLIKTKTSYGEEKDCWVSVLYRAPGKPENTGKGKML